MHLRRSARLCQNRRVRTKRRYHTTQPVLLTALQLGYRLNPSRKVPFHPPIKRRQFDQINAYEISEGVEALLARPRPNPLAPRPTATNVLQAQQELMHQLFASRLMSTET